MGNFIVVTLMLGITAGAWGQTGNDLQMVPPNVVKDILPPPKVVPPAKTAPPATSQPSAPPPVAPYASKLSDVPPTAPFNEPNAFADDLVAPPNAVPQLFWLRADYMLSWIRQENTPPLISALPGSFANTTTTIPPNAANTLFPNNDRLTFNTLNGARINTGLWLTDDHSWGIDATGFVTTSSSVGAAYSSLGSPILARYYSSANSGQPTYLFFSSPSVFSTTPPTNGFSGAISASATVSTIYSGDVNLRYNSYRFLSDNTDLLFGFRYFDLRESLQINAVAHLPPPDAQTLRVVDQFSVTNNFYGGQFGFASRWMGWRNFSFDGIVKMGVGTMVEGATVNGSNSFTSRSGAVSTQSGGLYAEPSNIGSYQRDKFTVIPEVTLNVNYNFTQRSSFFVGWNYLWVSNVVRTANVIDPTVNDSNVRYVANPTPGNAPGPTVTLRGQAFWMQGINFGVKFEY